MAIINNRLLKQWLLGRISEDISDLSKVELLQKDIYSFLEEHNFLKKENEPYNRFKDKMANVKSSKLVHRIEFQNGSILNIPNILPEERGRGDSPILEQELPHEDSIFTLSVITPYDEIQLLDFFKLSGLDFEKGRIILKDYSKIGMSISTINNLLKLGHLSY